MKKLLGILVLSLLFCNVGFAEKIIFFDCAVKKDNFIFNSKMWERNEIIIDTYAKTVTSIMVRTDEMMKKKYTRKNIIFGPDKLDFIIDGYAVRRLYKDGELKVELIYDLKKKTKEFVEHGELGQVRLTKCK